MSKYIKISCAIFSLILGISLVGCSTSSRGTPPQPRDSSNVTVGHPIPGQENANNNQGAGQYMSDAGLTASVKTALVATKGIPARKITVKSHNGIVQLSGTVNNHKQIMRAVQVAKSIEGVKYVNNNLKVRAVHHKKNSHETNMNNTTKTSTTTKDSVDNNK